MSSKLDFQNAGSILTTLHSKINFTNQITTGLWSIYLPHDAADDGAPAEWSLKRFQHNFAPEIIFLSSCIAITQEELSGRTAWMQMGCDSFLLPWLYIYILLLLLLFFKKL
jgi:hypothetical protein